LDSEASTDTADDAGRAPAVGDGAGLLGPAGAADGRGGAAEFAELTPLVEDVGGAGAAGVAGLAVLAAPPRDCAGVLRGTGVEPAFESPARGAALAAVTGAGFLASGGTIAADGGLRRRRRRINAATTTTSRTAGPTITATSVFPDKPL
jgi:hypothetical protein